MRRLFALAVFLIVYGSLYPWRFEARELGANPLWILANAWTWAFNRYLPRDLIVNIALYAPLGLTARLAFGGFAAPVAIAVALAAALEMAQLFVPGRNTSAMDVVTNGAGAAIGAALAGPLQRILRRRESARPADAGALALLLCWLVYLLFPFFPVGPFTLSRKLAAFPRGPLFEAMPFASAALAWLVAGRLAVASGGRPRWVWALALAVPAQFAVTSRAPSPSDLLGAVAGCLVFTLVGAPARAVSAAFLTLLLLRGLAPFHFDVAPKHFNWIPFGGFLNDNWQSATLTLLEKVFYYWAAIWTLRSAGAGLGVATAAVAALLGAIEAAQLWLPGRTPEIADPLLAVLIGLALYWSSDGLRLAAVEVDQRAV